MARLLRAKVAVVGVAMEALLGPNPVVAASVRIILLLLLGRSRSVALAEDLLAWLIRPADDEGSDIPVPTTAPAPETAELWPVIPAALGPAAVVPGVVEVLAVLLLL